MTGWATAFFWLGMVWLGYVYAGYPLLLAAVGSLRKVRPVIDDRYRTSVSVLIAARNEERDIGWKIAETLAWTYPPGLVEILVASDASEDRTDEIIRGLGDPRVKLVRMERRGGKNRALNVLAQIATGELLFFTDANSHIEPTCLARMVRHFADCRVGCVTGNSYSSENDCKPVQETGSTLYWGYELLVKSLENRFGSVLVADGAIFCIRKSLYTPVSPELANDLELPLRIGDAGHWTRYESGARVLEKDTNSPYEEFTRRRRICGQGALAIRQLRASLNGTRSWQFFSQKFLRWLTLIPLFMVFVASGALASNRNCALLFGLQVIFYSAAVVGLTCAAQRRRIGPMFSIPLYVLVSTIGALTGVIDAYVLRRRYDIWESPSMSRGRTVSGMQGIRN